MNTPTAAVAAATLRGLAQAILNLDLTHPHAFEQVVSIGFEIERTAGKVVEEGEDTNSPAEDDAMDELERLVKTNPSLDPIFQHLLACVRPA